MMENLLEPLLAIMDLRIPDTLATERAKCTILHSLSLGSRNCAMVRALASYQCRTRRHMWVEFVVGSRPCPEGFFSGNSGLPSP